MTDFTSATGGAHSRADVATPRASRYLQQLCKHFAHKIPVTFDASAGQITFQGGVCRLNAEGDRLALSLDAPDPAALDRLQDVVARHLVRFAFREEMQIDWHPVPADQSAAAE